MIRKTVFSRKLLKINGSAHTGLKMEKDAVFRLNALNIKVLSNG